MTHLPDPWASAAIPQKIPTRALHHWAFFFLIISPPPLAPWALEGYRGADAVSLLALSCKANWGVKSRAHQDGSGCLQQQYSRNFSAFDMLEKSQFSRFVEDTSWLRCIGDQSPPIPHQAAGWTCAQDWLKAVCLCLVQPDPQLMNHTAQY